MSTENPSQHEANKVLRVLSGKRLKFTIRLQRPNGSKLEWQSDYSPDVHYDDSTRQTWVIQRNGDYGRSPITEWIPGSVLLVEENPKD